MSFIKNHLFSNFEAPVVDLSGRTVIVTGPTKGSLGYETALHYARSGVSRLILASRNLTKLEDAKEQIQADLPNFKGQIETWEVNQAKFESVRAFCDRMDGLDRLDIAVFNAGVAHFSWATTDEGYEDTLQVNVITTGMLALRSLSVLSRTGDKHPSSIKPHCVIVASEVHAWAKLAQQDEPNIIEALNSKEKATPQDTYNISKLLDVFIGREIAKLPAASKVTVCTVNPGLCKSDLRKDLPYPVAVLFNWVAWSTEKGARNFLYAGVTDVTSGAYITDCKETEPAPFVGSEKGQKVQKQIWGELSDLWIKLDPKIESILH